VSAAVSNAVAPTRSRELLGHPTCLFTLFFTELWERFSFYGMKALLILYMVNYLFWSQQAASTVLRWYAGLVYLTPVLGGWLADRYLGARWSVFLGGILIAIGHFLLAFEPLPFFFSGLGFLIAGVGLLKPNISTQVGALYHPADRRRDSAFTIFYMGINLGAFLGPIICGYLRVRYSYHHGFAAAGVGMVIGLIVYILGMGSVARRTAEIAAAARTDATDAGLPKTKGPERAKPSVDARVYRDRCIVLVIICVFCILFWVGFEQGANVMNIWADKHTNLYVFRAQPPEVIAANAAAEGESGGVPGLRNVQIAAEQTQSINPLFILLLAPVFAWLWTYLDRRGKQPSTPMKMALGVFFAMLAYGAMLAGAAAENRPTRAPLSRVPTGVDLGRYGATRLSWDAATQTLHMNGVLADLDWMRALGASSSPAYAAAVNDLARRAEQRAEELRRARRAGTAAQTRWSVEVAVPAEAGEPVAVAGWPTENGQPKVTWEPRTRTLTAFGLLSERDRAQTLANGADPEFARALTDIYRQSQQNRVSIGWLILFYLLLTIGELCLSPVGLSFVTKAAPPGYVGLFMGLWFLTTGGVANWLAHYAGGYWGTMTPTAYFLIFGGIAAAATVLMLLLLRVLKPLLHGLN